MSPRDRRRAVGAGLLVLGVLSLVAPVFLPVGSELVHDTGPFTDENRAGLEERGVTVVAYESMSERGQELYREALLTDGRYSVPTGEGIPRLSYPDGDSRLVAVERPADDEDLPPSDELGSVPTEGDLPEEERERRQTVQRYDLMELSTGTPPLDSLSQLLRLVAGLVAVVSLGAGGYLSALPATRRDAG